MVISMESRAADGPPGTPVAASVEGYAKGTAPGRVFRPAFREAASDSLLHPEVTTHRVKTMWQANLHMIRPVGSKFPPIVGREGAGPEGPRAELPCKERRPARFLVQRGVFTHPSRPRLDRGPGAMIRNSFSNRGFT